MDAANTISLGGVIIGYCVVLYWLGKKTRVVRGGFVLYWPKRFFYWIGRHRQRLKVGYCNMFWGVIINFLGPSTN